MQLFFLRHGEAAPNRDDDIRELTPHGRDEVMSVARANRERLACVTQVLVSPITRAQQTADIFCREAGISAPRRTVDWLVHETPLREALRGLAVEEGNVLLVGHQPLAGRLVDSLCAQDGAGDFIGTAHLLEMEGESFIAGMLSLRGHYRP